MLYQKFTTLAVLFIQTSLVRPAVLPSEYLKARDDDAFNSTLDSRDDTHDLNPGERGMLNDQNNAYEGIFWDTAYPGGNGPRGSSGDGGCIVEQYNILVEATRNAVRLARFSGTDLIQEDRSYNKFFVRNRVAPAGGRWTSSKDLQNTYASIRHNMLLPSRFPLDGTGKRRRPQRIGYQCKDTDFLPVGNKGCAGAASAYTANPAINPLGWTIVFCPKFFKDLKYLNEILARPSVAEGDLGGRDLVSYEQVILHEWLHNDIMGFSEHLTDLVDKIDNNGIARKIYGMSEARDYAWKFMKGSEMKVNKNIVANVENYVWYFVDKMFGDQWGWTGDGSAYPKKKRQLERVVDHIARQDAVQADTLDLGDESTDPSTLPTATWPANCHGDLAIGTDDASALVCDYVNPPNDDSTSPTPAPTSTSTPQVVTLPPDPKNCNCNEDGCTADSPACCANGTC